MPLDALVVLGCRAGERGELSGAARRRVEQAARLYAAGRAGLVIASGGKRWFGLSEADAFAARLIELGVPSGRILREQQSRTTRGNARHVAVLAAARGLGRLGIVTCDWHMPRALSAFARHSLEVEPLPAPAPEAGWRRAGVRRALERVRGFGDRLAVAFLERPGRSGW